MAFVREYLRLVALIIHTLAWPLLWARSIAMRPVHTFSRWLGRRRTSLLLLSLIFFGIGAKTALVPAQDSGQFAFYAFLPVPIRLILWIVPSVVGILAVFKLVRRSGLGFGIISIPAIMLFCSHLGSLVAYWCGAYEANAMEIGARFVSILEWALILGLVINDSKTVDIPIDESAAVQPVPVQEALVPEESGVAE